MPRHKRSRLILCPPTIRGLSVLGMQRPKAEKINLYFEEYQTIKLLDYEGMTQEEAAAHMNISRPTLTRIYETARQKVARALTEGKDLLIRGGNFHFEDSWFRCPLCKANFNIYNDTEKVCPICKSKNIISLNRYYEEEE